MRTERVVQESKSTNSPARENMKPVFNELLVSDLDFKNSSNSSLRHYWHAFPAKFPPEIPRLFIENLTEEGDIVLDPMAGSCTTLLEAVILKRDAIGFEIDPLSLILGQAKFKNFKPEEPYQIGNSLIHRAVDIYRNHGDVLKNDLKERFDKETL